MSPISRSAIANLWTAYGLRGDPFFLQPLEPALGADAARPASLLVGRDDEIARIITLVESSDNSRTVIQGDAGVGKTSFVSAIKMQLPSRRILTHADPIRIQPTMTPASFIAEVLKVMLQMRATERLQAGTVANVRQRVAAGLRDQEAEFWTRVSRIIIGEDNTGLGITAGVVGVQSQRGRIAAETADLSLFNELDTALRVRGATVRTVSRRTARIPRRAWVGDANMGSDTSGTTHGNPRHHSRRQSAGTRRTRRKDRRERHDASG